jgi:YHYH protein/Secretion system C-terminal sorting domain
MTHSKIKPFYIAILLFLSSQFADAQAVMTKWAFNVNGQKATYYANTNFGSGSPVYVYTTSPDSADILKVCYNSTYTYVSSDGLTINMGQYLNPGYCYAQNYIHRFPRTPTVPSTKTIAPKTGAIGLLNNGIPIYGLGDSKSWNGSTNSNMGSGIWNVEVYKSEGFTLDTAFAAHPQQQSAYHTHASPYRLYKNVASSTHSPLIGFAFDGNPVYGPYGYSTAMDATSAVTRMKTGYSLRSITVRNKLPYNVTPSQNGPAVNATYPIGTYCEDYEWLSTNGGHLDKYNGRTCVTPEYPSGTYAYFVTISSAGVPQFPYIIGIEYYGAPDTGNFTTAGATSNSVTIPSTGVTCVYASNSVYLLPLELVQFDGQAEKNRNKIVWNTASETNVKHFVIERSKDGQIFEAIGTERSKGNSKNNQIYQFFDENPLYLAYYRLRAVDNDGSEEFSKTITVLQKRSNSLTIYPNLVNDFIKITNNNAIEEATINVFDIAGHLILSHSLLMEKDETKELDFSAFAKGMYLISIDAANFKQVEKIIKQ